MEFHPEPDDEDVSLEAIEGGDIDELEEVSWETWHRAETAKSLALWLVAVLGGGLLLHYIFVLFLAFGGKEAALETLGSAFNAWLPVISSLLSAAATYYFTKERG